VTHKKREKPKRSRAQPKFSRDVTIKLAQCVLFALNNHKHMSRGGGLMISIKDKVSLGRWQDRFMDALDGVGYCLDRDAYYKAQEPKRKRSTL
jgi:hypothetical protein